MQPVGGGRNYHCGYGHFSGKESGDGWQVGGNEVDRGRQWETRASVLLGTNGRAATGT